MDKHTKGPWKLENLPSYNQGEPCYGLVGLYGEFIGWLNKWEDDPEGSAANARRIVACVNALTGIPTEALEAGAVKVAVAAFWKYGRHHYDCTAIEDATTQCSCGVRSISSALAGLKPDPEGE